MSQMNWNWEKDQKILQECQKEFDTLKIEKKIFFKKVNENSLGFLLIGEEDFKH